MVVRYVCIFHLKNALLANDDYWHLFINLWVFFSTLITNGVNWFLPGLYTPTYEICACTLQDYNQISKFEGTALVSTLFTMTVYVLASARIKIYKHKTTSMVYPTEISSFAKNKLIAELTLTIGPTFLITVIFLVSLFMGKTRTGIPYYQYPYYLIIYLQYLIVIPFIVIIFVAFFYAYNKQVQKTIQRELSNGISN